MEWQVEPAGRHEWALIGQPAEHPEDRTQLQAIIPARTQKQLPAAVRTRRVVPSSSRPGAPFVRVTSSRSPAWSLCARTNLSPWPPTATRGS